MPEDREFLRQELMSGRRDLPRPDEVAEGTSAVMPYLVIDRTGREVEPVTPTDTEWAEFEEHFDKHKSELGTCGRPYGTPCAHEHACIRCPVVQVDPRMLARLDEIEADLLARREQAEHEGWHGEIEGLDLTLSLLRAKRAHAQRFTRRVPLGLPTPRPKP